MREKFSLSVVSYKNYPDIINLIRSLERVSDCELIKKIYVIDNGANLCSTKEKKDFQKFLKRNKKIEYIDTKENLGFGKAHNLILNELDTKYHIIINPDVLFVEDSLSKIDSFMENNPNVGMCVPLIIDENGEKIEAYRKELTLFDMFIRMFCRQIFPNRIKNHTLNNMDYSKKFQVPFAQGSFLVIRTSLFKELGGFDDRFFMYLEDADLCKRVNEVSSIYYFPETKVIHKWEKGSHKSMKLFVYHLKSTAEYFKKWGIKLF